VRPFAALNRFFSRLPIHLSLVAIALLWVIPVAGVLVTSFRSREAVRSTGWWTVFAPAVGPGGELYQAYCAECHADSGDALPAADLSSAEVVARFPRSTDLLQVVRAEVAGGPHLLDPPLPESTREALDLLAPIGDHLRVLSGIDPAEGELLGLRNYADALVGYKGTQDYLTDCQQGVASTLAKFKCDASDLANPEGMGRAFLNTLAVAIPSALLPIVLAAFAAYAFAWMDFPGRQWIFALLVGLQIIPLQLALVPIARLYSQIGLQGTFLGVWLFHSAFGLSYAIFLLRSFIGSLPTEIFESAYIDGATHWTVFRRLALPLAVPAIASLGIFQFLWIWNDFLVAKVFLSGQPVLTVQVTNLIDPRGGNWHLLTGAAFLSFLVPMAVFLGLQRFFVRGLLAGSVKG
jgi:alpha-glucoside transport system permease protein